MQPEILILSSPILGTFYAAPSPDSDPYVQVGDRVSAGQVLCIVEAMKLMNEIEAEVAGGEPAFDAFGVHGRSGTRSTRRRRWSSCDSSC